MAHRRVAGNYVNQQRCIITFENRKSPQVDSTFCTAVDTAVARRCLGSLVHTLGARGAATGNQAVQLLRQHKTDIRHTNSVGQQKRSRTRAANNKTTHPCCARSLRIWTDRGGGGLIRPNHARKKAASKFKFRTSTTVLRFRIIGL